MTDSKEKKTPASPSERPETTMVLRLVTKASIGVIVTSGVSYLYLTQNRSGRVMKTAGLIVIDYKWSLQNLISDSDQYKTALSSTHTRSAHKLYSLCCENKGTYIKLGQLLGALDYILPKEYTEVLKAFHDDAPKSSFKDIEKVSNMK